MMKYSRAAAVILATLGLSLTAASPASAIGNGHGNPPPTGTGSCQGQTCTVGLGQITVTGDSGGRGGGHFTPIDVPPPPCIWSPIGDATTGSEVVLAVAGAIAVGVTLVGVLPPDLIPFVQQATNLMKNPVPGEWYILNINPTDNETQAESCNALPPFDWVPAGGAPPVQPVPPEVLARFAYNHFTIPLPQLTISPVGRGVVNLGTYVWARWRLSRITHQEDVYQVKAQLGNTVVTVQAKAQPLSISAVGPGTTFTAGCGPNGSRFPVSSPPATAGAGTAPDCGVLWRGPDANAQIIVTADWAVTWWANDGVVHTLPDIRVQSRPTTIAVNEIEGINGNQ